MSRVELRVGIDKTGSAGCLDSWCWQDRVGGGGGAQQRVSTG
jgi:hypothetical protein